MAGRIGEGRAKGSALPSPLTQRKGRFSMSIDEGKAVAVTVTSRFKTNVLTSSTTRHKLMPDMISTYAEERSQILAVLEGVMAADHVIVGYEVEKESV